MLNNKYIILLTLAISLLLNSQQGAGSAQEAMEIVDLVVEGTNVSTDVIKLSSGLGKGEKVYGEDIQNAIRKLWGLNLFSDVIIEAKTLDNGKIFLKVILEEIPRLNSVKILGIEEFKEEDIEPLIKLRKGQVLKKSNLTDLGNTIKDFYGSENFLLANVEFKTEHINEKEVDLTITIDEGKEIFIEDITFKGNTIFDKGDLMDNFEETHEDAWWRDGEYKRELFEGDLERLVYFYQNNGYKDMEVVSDSVYFNDSNDEIYIDVNILEGKKYFFGNTKFEGNSLFSDEELARGLDFEKGDVFSQELFDMSLYNNLSTMYMDKGYLRAQIVPEEQLTGADTVSYRFKISEGTRARVRKVKFVGNTRTNEKVLRREMAIYPGDIFNKTKILRSQRNAMILNYFEMVMPDMVPVNDQEVDLVFSIKEKATEQAQTSIAYSESDGFVGSIGLVFNNFSFAHPFRLGDGQKLSTNIEFGSEYYKYSISVEEPWLNDTPTLIGLSANYQKRSDSYSDTHIVGGLVKLGRRFAWSDNWMRGIWYYSLDRVEYSNVKDNSPTEYELFEGKTIISSAVTEYLIRDSRDRADFPSRGSTLSLMTKLAGGIFGGDEEFHKHKLDIKWYQPIYKDRLVLYTHYVIGVMDKLNESSYISSREYFYMGGGGLSGGEPLRGYDENSIGPYENGYYIGGRNMFKSSVELRFKVTDDPMLVYGLAFFDAGNLWKDFTEANIFDLQKGAGLGIRINVPMLGMMGLDFGYGFDYFEDFGKQADWSENLRTHFRMGTNL